MGSPTDRSPAGRQSAEVAERTRAAIIDAALSVFAERGFEGASLRDIAKRAGTTHSLIRHHFGSKEDVFRAVVDHSVSVYAEMAAPMLERVRRGEHLDDPLGLLEQDLRLFAETSARHPEAMRLLMHEGSRPAGERLEYVYERIDALRGTFELLFEEARARCDALAVFDCDSYFLFLLTNLGLPFGLAPFASRYAGADLRTPEGAERQVERVLALLGLRHD